MKKRKERKLRVGDRERRIWRREIHRVLSSDVLADRLVVPRQQVGFVRVILSPFLVLWKRCSFVSRFITNKDFVFKEEWVLNHYHIIAGVFFKWLKCHWIFKIWGIFYGILEVKILMSFSFQNKIYLTTNDFGDNLT